MTTGGSLEQPCLVCNTQLVASVLSDRGTTDPDRRGSSVAVGAGLRMRCAMGSGVAAKNSWGGRATDLLE
jgi:hypothetical protein